MKPYSMVWMILLLLPGTVWAADHMNLEEGLPTEIEDAYPTAFRNREIQAVTRYERTGEPHHVFTLEPRVEFGFAPNWQGKVSAPIFLGAGDKRDSGNVKLEAFYNFNTEGLKWPALALSAGTDLPTGRDSAGVDTTLKFLATKSITRRGLDRLH